MSKSDTIAIFVHQQNLERYRRLLQTALNVERRRMVVDLLAQEEVAEQQVVRASEDAVTA